MAAVHRRVRVEMRPEGGRVFRGARLPGDDGADAAGSGITAKSYPCTVLVGGGARWGKFVAAAGAAAEPWPEWADAAGAVLAAEPSPCQVFVRGGARWATIVAAAGAAAEPWPEGVDAAGAVLTAESSPCKMLVGGGARWATTIFAAAGASAEPWSPPGITTKTEAKAASAAGENTRRRGWRSTVAHG